MSDPVDDARLSPLAEALASEVAQSRTARVQLDVLRERAHQVDLSMAGSPDARSRLRNAVDELVAAGRVTVPKGTGGWDRVAAPALPNYVTRVRKPTAAPAAADVRTQRAWNVQLSWVPQFLANERPTSSERALLNAVHEYLVSRTAHAAPVALRERSLQLLGDEKGLDSMLRGRLFTTPGRLTLELIEAVRVVPPLVSTTTGVGPDVLVVENYATYVTLTQTLAGHRDVGRVVWGAGNQVTQMLPQLPAPAGRLLYFGDLDVRGLEIGAAATATAADVELPALAPCGVLYALLLEHGIRGAVTGRTPTPERVRDAVRWLPTALRRQAADVLSGGERLAQEAISSDLFVDVRLPDIRC